MVNSARYYGRIFLRGSVTVLFALALGIILNTAMPVRPVSAREVEARPFKSTYVEQFDTQTADMTLWLYWVGFPFGSCPLATISAPDIGGYFETLAKCYGGQGAIALHISGATLGGSGLYLPYYLARQNVFINHIWMYTNCGPGASCFLRVIHDDGTFTDGAVQTSNTIDMVVNHLERDVRVVLITADPNAYKDPTISNIQVEYDLSVGTATPTPTTEPSVTPYPTNTAVPGTVAPTATGTLYPTNTAVPTLMASMVATYPPIITPDDGCPVDLAIPCGAPIQFEMPSLPLLVLPSPTAIAMLPTPTAHEVTNTPAPSNTPTTVVTYGPSPTPVPGNVQRGFDTSGIDKLGNDVENAARTMIPLADNNMGGSSIESGAASVGGSIGGVVAFMRGLEMTELNKPAGIVSFLILLLVLTVLVEVFTFVIPIILWVVRLVLEVITAFKPF